jgi:predicted nucleic acid-binding protein
VIFDTDIFIWVQRGNLKAAEVIEKATERFLSVQTYMELMQGASSKTQHKATRNFLKEFGFTILPLSENIGHRASVYIDTYSLSHGLHAADALIAATAVENTLPLCSSNAKHYKIIPELQFKRFKAD